MSANVQEMIYGRLGKTGLKVSKLGFGAWVTFGNQLGVAQAAKIIKQCLDGGINFFDNAEAYEAGVAEEVMGEAFKELGVPRTDYVLATKLFRGGSEANSTGLNRKHVIEGTQASLKRLQVDYVDVIFAHRPDHTTPIEETVRAFNYVIERGWAFYWGTSEWTGRQLQEAFDVASRLNLIPPAVEQPQYNLFERTKLEVDYLPLFHSHYGLGTTIWSPLASGLLTGKYSKDHIPEGSRFALGKYNFIKERSIVDDKLEKVEKLKAVADELGATLPQLAIAWTLKNPNVSVVLLGATKEAQITDNLASLDFLDRLTPDVLKRIDDIFPAPKAAQTYFSLEGFQNIQQPVY